MYIFFNNSEIKYLQNALIEEELYHEFNYEFLLSYIEEFTNQTDIDYISVFKNNNIIHLVNELFYKNLSAGSNLCYRTIVYLFNKYFDIDITNQNKINCIDIIAYKFTSKHYNIRSDNITDIIKEIIDILNIPNVNKEEIINNIYEDFHYFTTIEDVIDIFIENNYPFDYNDFAKILDEEFICIRDLKKEDCFIKSNNSNVDTKKVLESRENKPKKILNVKVEVISNKITNKDELKMGILTNNQTIKLYELCNWNIFDYCKFDDFVNSFNNPDEWNLNVLRGSKNKFYVLLGWLNSFYKTRKNENVFKILEKIEITKEDYYKKKPREDDPNYSGKQKKFNDKISEIWELKE